MAKRAIRQPIRKSPERYKQSRATVQRSERSPERRKQSKATVTRNSSPERSKQSKATVTRTKRKTTDVQRRPRGGASPASKANQAAYRRFMAMTPAQRAYVIKNATKRSAR